LSNNKDYQIIAQKTEKQPKQLMSTINSSSKVSFGKIPLMP